MRPGHVAHQIEHAADDRIVRAQVQRLRDRYRAAAQGVQHAELTVDGMCRSEQLARRFAPQHVAARRRLDQVGRIGLPAPELRRRRRTAKTE